MGKKLNLLPVNLIVGKNGSGKTALCNLIMKQKDSSKKFLVKIRENPDILRLEQIYKYLYEFAYKKMHKPFHSDFHYYLIVDDYLLGCDVEKIQVFTEKILKLSKTFKITFVLTSNQEGVINTIPLINHHYLHRTERGKTRIYNHQNRIKQIKEFQFIGLNNYDYFTSQYYRTYA